jgi:hypothetical protein
MDDEPRITKQWILFLVRIFVILLFVAIIFYGYLVLVGTAPTF